MMRAAGRVVHEVLERLAAIAEAGMTTGQLDAEAERICREVGGECLFKGVPGVGGPFPGNICCSINEQVVHGIPGDRVICDGDLVSIDFGVRMHGYCGDAARTLLIGNVTEEKRRLTEVAEKMLAIAVEQSGPGRRWSKVAGAMQECAEQAGFGVVRQFVGHGIGTEMHEEPKVPNYVSPSLLRNDIVLREGLVLAVEPMVNGGSSEVVIERDDWTVVTKDG
ncbi:MAG: type I methionyl aminopeptidase, partial [Planctomycetes bacterium]|nr:type I methionyl aminopeptidase [Planctomycetota bacterium]